MKITRGYKTELDPTVKQHMLLCQCTGTARFAYNYGLARKQEVYKESGKFISAIDLQKELTARKRTDLPWLKGVSKWLVQKKAELRKVKVSQSIDGRSVVDEGLSPGQQVITGGQFKVQPGTLVSTAVASSDPAQPKVKQE